MAIITKVLVTKQMIRRIVILCLVLSPIAVAEEKTPAMVIPSPEKIAADLGYKPNEFKTHLDEFATALSQGSASQALKRLCARDESACNLLKDFQAQATDAKRERLRAKKRGKKIQVTDKNIEEVQRMEFQVLVRSVNTDKEDKLAALATKSLSVASCPRNLSAALSVKAEEHYPSPAMRAVAKELFNHARQCLQPEEVAYERLFMRQGLYAYYEGDKARAKEYLTAAAKATKPSERYRVLYWLGKIAQENGAKPEANTDWKILMDTYPLSFYAFEAAVANNLDPMQMITQRRVEGVKREKKDDPELNLMIHWLEALYVYKKPAAAAKWASWIVRSNEDDLDVDVLHYISTIKIAAGMYRSNITMLFTYFKKNPAALNEESLRLLYPRPYYSLIVEAGQGRIDNMLVLGLVRQESAFDPNAVSRVKAKGLMQIMPSTARRLASGGHKKLLNEKANTEMGVKYLLQLSGKFNGSAELVLAAYNAGPMRVEDWLKRNPDRDKNLLLWNDLIPYMETRDYVVSILRNNYLYTRLYGNPAETVENKVFSSQLVKQMLSSNSKK